MANAHVEARVKTFDLSGKIALVTGAGRGFGREFCRYLAGANATVIATDQNQETADATAAAVRREGGQTHSFELDVTDPRQIRETFDAVVAQFGRLDILVNNAGINTGNDTPPEALPLETWDRVIGTNLTGCFLCCQAAARSMIPASAGKIINVASAAAARIPRLTGRHVTSYAVSKAAIVMLTRCLGLEWARYGITVNSISPTFSNTALIVRDPTLLEQMIESSPFRRLGEPHDLAGALLYLASSASDFMTGQDLLVDGGFSL